MEIHLKHHDNDHEFDKNCADVYDKQREKLAVIKDVLHLLMRIILSELPEKANILCVDAGTGAELIYLAQAFPKWHFTAVDPAVPILEKCRQQMIKEGLESQCDFHAGYLDTLHDTTEASETIKYDAATCILVSHFLTDAVDRIDLFRQISLRLKNNGILISTDLASDMTSNKFSQLSDIWFNALSYSGLPTEEIEKMKTSIGNQVAVLAPKEVESIIVSGGFESPTLFYQSLLIHAWYAKRAP